MTVGSVHWFDLRVLFCFFSSKITMSYFLLDCLLILHCKKPGLFWRLIVTLKLLCDAAELIWSLRVEPSKNGPQWSLFLREYIGSQVSNFGIMKGDLLVTGHWTGFSYYPVNLFPQITVACYQKQPTFFYPQMNHTKCNICEQKEHVVLSHILLHTHYWHKLACEDSAKHLCNIQTAVGTSNFPALSIMLCR